MDKSGIETGTGNLSRWREDRYERHLGVDQILG